MIEMSLTRMAVAAGALALSLTAAAGFASADPDLGPIVNTPCNYTQLMAALNAQDPAVATQFNLSPVAQSYLRQFLSSSPCRRMARAQQLAASPAADQSFGLVQQVAATCHNY